MKRLYIFLFLLLSCSFSAEAQFQTVYIGVNGLTCSQCSRTVEMRIRKLDCVADVQMNLQHTEGKIILKKDEKADMEKIAQAVFDAGFSVRFLEADFNVDNSSGISGSCFVYKGDGYVFNHTAKEPLKGIVKLKFIGKKFMPKSEYKKARIKPDVKCEGITGNTFYVIPNPAR